MTRDEYSAIQDDIHKQRLQRYGRLFDTEDGKWVLEDLKNKTIYNTATSKSCATSNNPLALAHLTGQRDLIAWVCMLLMSKDYAPAPHEGDLNAG